MYPPEEVEARRWEKIAKGLGTRTAQQVLQYLFYFTKYFLNITGVIIQPLDNAVLFQKNIFFNPKIKNNN